MYTEIDIIAYHLFMMDYYDGMIDTKISKPFFVTYKNDYPYNTYYEKAKNIIRKEKLNKIKSKL